MSCKLCEEQREIVTFYRWKNANMGLVGCPIHVDEVIDVLNKQQAADSEKRPSSERPLDTE